MDEHIYESYTNIDTRTRVEYEQTYNPSLPTNSLHFSFWGVLSNFLHFKTY